MRWIGLALLTLLAAGCTQTLVSQESPTPGATGTPDAPAFNLLSAQGEAVTFTPGKKVTLIAFWSPSWDPDHLAQLRALTELHERYANRGLRIVAVTYDEQPQKVRAVLQEHPVPFEVAVGAENTYERFGLENLPTALLVNREGVTVERFEGHRDVSELGEKIEPLLR